MDDLNFEIRTMARHELDIVVEWAAQEGWNPGKSDAKSFYAVDPEGFLVGVLNGEVIASISVVKYDDTFGFLGFYIVRQDFRDQGYGYRLWKAGMGRLAGCNVGLDGVVDQQDNYRKSGFSLAYGNIRYQGLGGGSYKHEQIMPLSEIQFDTLRVFDRKYFPAERSNFLHSWINIPGSFSSAFMSGSALEGFGVIRPCMEGYKVGPLFASSAEVAEAIFLDLQSKLKDTEVIFLDVPEVNVAATKLAQKYNMDMVFKTARMYTAEQPEIDLDGVYGVTSFELG